MKQKIILTAIMLTISSGIAYAETTERNIHPILKISADGFFANEEHNTQSYDSELYGGTLYGGLIGNFFQQARPEQVLLEISKRKGNLERFDQDDTEFLLTYQWLGERFQPLFGVGKAYSSTSFNAEYGDHGNDEDLDLFLIGAGLGVTIGNIGQVSFNGKLEGYYITGDGEIDWGGTHDIDGYRLKFSAQGVYPLEFESESITSAGLFVQPGYQYQQIDYTAEWGGQSTSEWEYSGFWIKAGLYFIF